jgi:alkylated DNA nucleotide flippase Atl1
MKRKKTWKEKLNNDNNLPKVVKIPPSMRSRWGKGTILIPSPRQVDEVMRRIPKGRVITINEIRTVLATRHHATMGCPITTGIFAWVAANAAEEAAREGKKRITPYWRTLKSGGELNPKYPGGIENQRARLEAEGHRVVKKGQKYLLVGHDKVLAKIPGQKA